MTDRHWDFRGQRSVSPPYPGWSIARAAADGGYRQDGTKLLTCSADKSAKLLDLQTGQPAQQIAAHDAPISCVKWIEVNGQPVAVTAGWDKMVKVCFSAWIKVLAGTLMVVQYWDMRQPNPMAQLQATERVYALDAVNDLMVRSVGLR